MESQRRTTVVLAGYPIARPQSTQRPSNNAGKSTIMAAICAFYDHEPFKYKKARDWPHEHADGDEAWVEVEFELTSEEATCAKEEYVLEGNRLRVRRYLHSEIVAHDGKSRAGALFAHTRDGLTHADFFYGERNVGKGKLGRVIYVPAVSRVEDHAKLSGPSALRDLLTEIMKDIVATGSAYGKLGEAFNEFGRDVRADSTAGGRSINGLEDAINREMSGWDIQFSIDVRPPDSGELIKSLSNYSVCECDSSHKLSAEDFGSGFQRQFIFTLITLRDTYTEPRKKVARTTFSPDLVILLFEEPEAFLHPSQQESLSNALRQLASAGVMQVMCSTHSSHFVSNHSSDLCAIVRVERVGRRVRTFQLTRTAWDDILQPASSDGDDVEAAERARYFLWLNPDRCGALFAKIP